MCTLIVHFSFLSRDTERLTLRGFVSIMDPTVLVHSCCLDCPSSRASWSPVPHSCLTIKCNAYIPNFRQDKLDWPKLGIRNEEYLELEENENTTHQNLWGVSKTVLWEKSIPLNNYARKRESSKVMKWLY